MKTWGIPESFAFAAVMTMMDMREEKEAEKHLIKTRKFYQECYEVIADQSEEAFNIVTSVVARITPKCIPIEIVTGGTYLPLFAFYLVIERQGYVTKEQSKIIKIFFEHFNYSFSSDSYIFAAKRGSDTGDFKKIIYLDKDFSGGFWVNFFRALYKAGTSKDLQDVVNRITAIITRFSLLGNPENNISYKLCDDFIDNVNYRGKKASEIAFNEVDWFGIVPIPDRLLELNTYYTTLIDNSNVTNNIPREDITSWLDLEILNCICDIVLMTKHPKSKKLEMINDAVDFVGIYTDITPEQYVKEIANNTEYGDFCKTLFSCGPPLGYFWVLLLTMSSVANKPHELTGIANNIFSILLQVEIHLDNKYGFLENKSIVKKYMAHIIEQLVDMCDEED